MKKETWFQQGLHELFEKHYKEARSNSIKAGIKKSKKANRKKK